MITTTFQLYTAMVEILIDSPSIVKLIYPNLLRMGLQH